VLVVCEGIPDALTAAQDGWSAVGVLGSQAPDHRVAARLASHAESFHGQLVAIVDADPAGREWGRRLGDLLADRHDLVVVEPPEGLDLNEWARHDTGWPEAMAGLDTSLSHRVPAGPTASPSVAAERLPTPEPFV
jgi:hypothetical protein